MSGEAPNTNAVDPFDFEWDPILSKAISDAEQRGYERGRKEGIEEAAKVVSGAKIYTYVSTGEFPTVRPIEHRDLIATAIRQLLEVKG